MRLTLPRVALAALVLLMPPAIYAFAQDQAPSSAPSSEPSTAPSSAPPADTNPSSEPPPVDDATGKPKPVDKHPRSATEIYQDLDFFGQVFDRIRSEYVDPPDEQA